MIEKQNNINHDDLKRMLHAGMGRAILYLLKQDLSKYRELILDSCLHKYAFLRGLEESHAQYLWPLICTSGEEEYYKTEILKALPDTQDPSDADQLLDFAVLFARKGCEQARKALYDKGIEYDKSDPELIGERQIIELDGAKGLTFLLNVIGSDPVLMDAYKYDFLIRQAEDISGIDEVYKVLNEASKTSPGVAAALANIEDYSLSWTLDEIKKMREEELNEDDPQPEVITWNELKNHPEFGRLTFDWGETASQEEFLKAAEDLDPNESTSRLRTHLWLFAYRPFPLDPQRIISLLDHPDESICNWSLKALGIINHDDVRELFFKLKETPRLSHWSVRLLINNYKSGDDKLILEIIEREDDAERLDQLCLDTIGVYQANPVLEGIKPLKLLYEKNPCSLCRHTCVETIQAIDSIPDWMIEECRYDTNSETRELAA